MIFFLLHNALEFLCQTEIRNEEAQTKHFRELSFALKG